MRVIAGKAKGHTLKCPKEPHIRPTADKIRGAIFSALESLQINWTPTLDLYAGTGALGIEALSRGAEEADFVEKNPKCCSIIKENLAHTGFTEKARVFRLEARKAIRKLEKQYGLVFMDPPYSSRNTQIILEEVADSHLVGRQSTIVMEHSQKVNTENSYGKFHMTKRLHHGDTCVSIFQQGGGLN